jgi:large subunit ribosomal protein L4|uniref:Large ribosomal subunit protein uL4c n=1 Tax=Pseudopedinella elastica TaxID=35684 RepID=A0A516ZAJ7_9STRA|nr:ribosomal protein L4 [Pseudopedinella elastica]QDR24731.1 ribosomal protein L4 [Pseudopedinella elastica]|tara:strand:- start:296 stop:943 length:648 start_codon:yes stop_codon:yes gene_type:complete
MVIKTFEYSIVDTAQSNDSITQGSFSLDVSDKAKYVVHRAIRTATTNRAQATSSTKTRSEVRGGGRKPWKQKGTGRARAGSTRSPLWRGGGVTFGPKPKLINKKINKKEKQLALRTLLYNRNEQIKVVKEFKFDEAKTSDLLRTLSDKLTLSENQKTLVISSKPNKNLQLSLRNLKNFNYILANQLNVNEIAKANQIIIDELSFQVIKETYCDKN